MTKKSPTRIGDIMKNTVAKIKRIVPPNIFGASGCFMSEFLMSSTLLEYHKNRKNTSFLGPFTSTLL